MLNLDLEPLKKLYQEILNTQALSEKELQNLAILIKKLQEVKEELDNSSFTILNKNTQLVKKSQTILTQIENLSNVLEKLKNKLNDEKINFDKEIKQKFDNLIESLNSSINSLTFQISDEKNKTEKEFRNFRETIENELKNTKKVISREKEELETLRRNYEKKLESSLNDFKKTLNEYDAEIEHKTFFKKWGAVFIALGIGILIGITILFARFREDILFSLKYSNICYYDNNQTYQCYIIPRNSNVVTISSDNSNYLIEK